MYGAILFLYVPYFRIIPISLVDQHPECTPGSVDVDKVGKKEIPGNRSTTEERLDEEAARDTADKKNFKDQAETETKQGERRDCRRNSIKAGAKQSEISFSEIKHPERQTIGSLESSHIEIVPKTEIRVGEPKEVVPLESSLPPLEDPSIILLSPSSTRRSDTAMVNETEGEKSEKPEEVLHETVKQEETQENKSESLDIKQLTSLQKQMAKNKQKTSTTNSSLSSKHDDYADLVEEVKHIKEDKAR